MNDTMTIARRKGNKVRYFDPRTARMGRWQPAPAPAVPIMSANSLNRFTVPELRSHAERYYGLRFKSKDRKETMVQAILSFQRSRQRTVQAIARYNEVNA